MELYPEFLELLSGVVMLILNRDDSCGAWNLIANVLFELGLLLDDDDRLVGSKLGKSNSKHPSIKLIGLDGGLHNFFSAPPTVEVVVVGNRIDPSNEVLDILRDLEKS